MDAVWLALAMSGAVCLLVGRVLPGAAAVADPRWAAATAVALPAIALTVWRPKGSGAVEAAARPTRDLVRRVLTAGTGLTAGCLGVWVWSRGIGVGLVDPAVSVFAVGTVAVAAAAVGAAWRATSSQPAPGRPGLAQGGSSRFSRLARWSAVAVVVGVVATVTPLVVGRVGVDASTASVTAIPAVPQVPGAGRWTWQPPGRVVGVVRAGPGVVAATAGGRLTALDGRTGRPRWHYGLAGTEVNGLASSPDGSSVLAVYARRVVTEGDEHQRLVVLDAVTGVLRWQQRLGTGDTFWTGLWTLSSTDHILPVLGSRRGLIEGHDLVSGARRWTWTSPPDCSAFDVAHIAGGASTVLALANCQVGKDVQVTVFGLDERTGGLRWQRTVASGRGSPPGFPVTSSDGQRVTLPDTGYVLEEGTGRPAVRQPPGEEGIPDVGSLPVVVPDDFWDDGAGSTIDVLQADGRRVPIQVKTPQYQPWVGGFHGSAFAVRAYIRVMRLGASLYGVATTDRTLLVVGVDAHREAVLAVHDLRTPAAAPRIISLHGAWTPRSVDQPSVESEAVAVLPAPGAVVLARLSPDPTQPAQPVIGLT